MKIDNQPLLRRSIVAAASTPPTLKPAPLLATRFFIPALPAAWLSRPRLLEQLAGAVNVPLTLVSASAGFGKSSLAREWLHTQSSLRTSWLSLESVDNEWGNFFRYFVTAWQHIVPTIGVAALAELDFSSAVNRETLLNSFLNDLAAQTVSSQADHVFVVLDDYQAICNREVHETVQYVVEHLPPHCHLILVTRSDPPLPLSRWRARGQLLELRTEALRFSTSETTGFLNQAMQLGLTDEQVRILDARTEGWIVGLQLAALSLSGSKDMDRFVQAFGGSHRHVLDYLIEEVLSQQTEEVEQFLLTISLLDRFCGPLCDVMLEWQDLRSQGMLQELERANLFLIPLDDQRVWFRLHHLLADLLRIRLRQAAPESIIKLYRRAAHWFAERSSWQEAVHYALQARDFELGAELLKQAVNTDGLDFLFGGVQNLIEPFPPELIHSLPQLALAKAASMIENSRTAGIKPLLRGAELAASQAPVTQDTSQLLGIIYAVEGVAASLVGDSEWILESSRQASRLLPNNPRARVNALIQLGNVYFFAGDFNEVDACWQQGLHISSGCGYTFGAFVLQDDLARLCCYKGDLVRAEALFQSSLRLLTAPGTPSPRWLGATQRDYSDLLCERNRLAEAHDLMTSSIPLIEKWDMASGQGLGYVHLGRILLAQGDCPGARLMLEKADELCRSHTVYPDLQAIIQMFRAELLMAEHAFEAASEALETGLRAPYGQHELHREWLLITQARLWLEKHDPTHVLALLAERRNKALECGRGRNWLEISLLMALAYRAQGQERESLDMLTEALKFAQPQGFIRIFLDKGQPMLDLLREFCRQPREAALRNYAATLQQAFAGPGRDAPLESPNAQLLDPLSTRELEILSLLCNGLSNQEIADELVLSVGTVKSHIHNIFRKLGVRDRPQAIATATKLGLIKG